MKADKPSRNLRPAKDLRIVQLTDDSRLQGKWFDGIILNGALPV